MDKPMIGFSAAFAKVITIIMQEFEEPELFFGIFNSILRNASNGYDYFTMWCSKSDYPKIKKVLVENGFGCEINEVVDNVTQIIEISW